MLKKTKDKLALMAKLKNKYPPSCKNCAHSHSEMDFHVICSKIPPRRIKAIDFLCENWQ